MRLDGQTFLQGDKVVKRAFRPAREWGGTRSPEEAMMVLTLVLYRALWKQGLRQNLSVADFHRAYHYMLIELKKLPQAEKLDSRLTWDEEMERYPELDIMLGAWAQAEDSLFGLERVDGKEVITFDEKQNTHALVTHLLEQDFPILGEENRLIAGIVLTAVAIYEGRVDFTGIE